MRQAAPASAMMAAMRLPMSVARTLLMLGLGTTGCGPSREPSPPPAMPIVEGTLALDGLSAPVTVVRDRWGVPHITAATADDLFFAQGFVQAQDRLFQMDLWRRSVQGRLAEVLGPTFIERDAMTRRMQYRGDLDTEWAHYAPGTRAIVSAFVRGINARVREAQADLPEAFVLAGWTPELWAPEDLLNRTDAFVASRAVQHDVLRARLMAAIGLSATDAVWPPLGAGRTTVPPGLDVSVVSPVVADVMRRVGTPPFFVALAVTEESLGPVAGGSNAWAVPGASSETGAPLLAADPHRLLSHPAERYLVHLTAPGWHVAGATAPWLPGVVVGHNAHIAWGMTALDADTQDLYLEQTNPDNPMQVRDGDAWVDMTTRHVAIASRGREPFEYDEQYTPRGVVVAVDRDRHLAYALRWSGHEPGAAGELVALAINQVDSWDTFRAAAARWRLPAVEFVYAGVDGRVEKTRAALVPERRVGDGLLPMPAWTGRHAWGPWTLPDETDARPETGFVVSANGHDGRTQRIETLLKAEARSSVESFTRLQQDVVSTDALRLVPLLTDVRVASGRAVVEAARRRLLMWDRRMRPDDADARLFAAWRERLMARLVALRVPPSLVSAFIADGPPVLVPALAAPTRAWFDGDAPAARDALLVAALAEAVDDERRGRERRPLLGDVLFAHPLAVTSRMRDRLNIGPFRLSGSADTVLSVSGVEQGAMTGPSLRVVFDLADWDRSLVTLAPGQSELPGSPHFRDLAALWAKGEYFPLAFSEAAVQAAAAQTLTLTPR